jgi:hypothetical protein
MNSDPFVGAWELDPETLNYQFGRPGRRATYVIEAIPGGLMFHLDAEDADRKPIQVTYGGELDGREQALAGGAAALVLTRYSENLIESTLKREGKVVDRWTREMLPDRKTIKITQYVLRPNGEELLNTGIYRKRE